MSRANENFFPVRSAAAAQGYIIGSGCTGVEIRGFLPASPAAWPAAQGSRMHWMVSKSLGNKGIFVLDLSKPASAPGNFFYIIEPMEHGVEP